MNEKTKKTPNIERLTVKKIVQEFFNKINKEAVVEEVEIKESVISFNLQTNEPELLIGRKGNILESSQHLLSKIFSKKAKEKIFVNLDINQYKKKKEIYLKEAAEAAANEVSLTKKEKKLMPMPAFDRRIIHIFLSGREDVFTESEGRGEERRVVIKPR